MSVNKAILVGNLGADPESRFTKGGTEVVNLRLATSEHVKGETKTEWHRVVVFGKTAENCSKYLHKGSQVYVEGRIQTSQWEDKDGNKRYTTEIVGYTVKFLSNKTGGHQETGTSTGFNSAYDQKPKDPDFDPGPPKVTEDDVPF